MPIIYCYRFCSALSLETVVFLYFLCYIVIWNYEKYSNSERKIFLSIVSTCKRIHFLIIKYVGFFCTWEGFSRERKNACTIGNLWFFCIEGGWVSEFGRMYGTWWGHCIALYRHCVYIIKSPFNAMWCILLLMTKTLERERKKLWFTYVTQLV